jgi:hypothetical protein
VVMQRAMTLTFLALLGCPPVPPAPDAGPSTDAGFSGCMASCPSPPVGCVRVSIDPGYCTPDSGCTSPPPMCRYAPAGSAQVECPPSMAGRCIPP